jgi:2-dehydro-3-deoxyphosphogluconate aldolase/(4S)-4-hydroxy-2-oxoglutarate aldolase
VTTEALEAILRHAKVVPILRAEDGDKAYATAQRLLGSGLTVIELTATTPGWQTSLARLRDEHPHATFGVGTVVKAADAETALDAGANFLVSPWPAQEVRDIASRRGVAFLEGGFTPAEMAAAAGRGIAKLFPAHVGGPAYLKSLMTVLPGARIMPTGGIRAADVASWLAAGALAVGIGHRF